MKPQHIGREQLSGVIHPDYLGHNELITDRSGNPYQYFHYTAWGESFAQAEATQGSFSSSYRFNAKELDQETGNYYYGARYYHPKWSVWVSVDRLASKGPGFTPYSFSHNNPIMLVDPDGNWPENRQGFILRTDFKGFSFSGAIGFSVSGSDAMGSLNLALNVYNYGLGTTSGSNGEYSWQIDFVVSAAITMGSNSGQSLAMNTFNNNTATGVENNYNNSASLGSNMVMNSSGRNQMVGYLGGRLGSVGVNLYNDIFLGDGDDRWHSGGGSVQFAMGNNYGTRMIGADVFTGQRFGKDKDGLWLSMPGNPAGGVHGTYGQDPSNQLLNNGQSISTLPGINPIDFKRTTGKGQMWSQNWIHNNLTHNLLFYSTAEDE